MKKIITILLVLCGLIVTAKDYQIGYFVFCEKNNKREITKTPYINVVEEILQQTFKYVYVNLEYELTNSRYFETENERDYFYVEIRKINKRGKYKRIKKSRF